MVKKKTITIEDLAGMVLRGFQELRNNIRNDIRKDFNEDLKKQFDLFRVEFKKELKSEIKLDIDAAKEEINSEIKKLTNRVSVSEQLLIQNHEPRICAAEKELNL
jgi:hypothetical protein